VAPLFILILRYLTIMRSYVHLCRLMTCSGTGDRISDCHGLVDAPGTLRGLNFSGFDHGQITSAVWNALGTRFQPRSRWALRAARDLLERRNIEHRSLFDTANTVHTHGKHSTDLWLKRMSFFIIIDKLIIKSRSSAIPKTKPLPCNSFQLQTFLPKRTR
jgi:hypothetical protein